MKGLPNYPAKWDWLLGGGQHGASHAAGVKPVGGGGEDWPWGLANCGIGSSEVRTRGGTVLGCGWCGVEEKGKATYL